LTSILLCYRLGENWKGGLRSGIPGKAPDDFRGREKQVRRKTRISQPFSGKRERYQRGQRFRIAAGKKGRSGYIRTIPRRAGQAGSRRRPSAVNDLDLARTVWEPEEVFSLPEGYGETRLLLLTVNPFLIHSSWEVVEADLKRCRLLAGQGQSRPVLRIYDVTYIYFDGTNAHSFFEVDVDLRTRNWYVPLWSPEKSYVAELGLKGSDDRFHPLARSNVTHTPRAWPSIRSEERYIRVKEDSEVSEPGLLHEQDQSLPGPAAEAREGVIVSNGKGTASGEIGMDFPPLEAARESTRSEEFPGPAGNTDVPLLGESEEILREKLKRVYGDLGGKGVSPPPQEASLGTYPLNDQDLTGACEHKFILGVSSRSAVK
jgi:hypothetical protein